LEDFTRAASGFSSSFTPGMTSETTGPFSPPPRVFTVFAGNWVTCFPSPSFAVISTGSETTVPLFGASDRAARNAAFGAAPTVTVRVVSTLLPEKDADAPNASAATSDWVSGVIVPVAAGSGACVSAATRASCTAAAARTSANVADAIPRACSAGEASAGVTVPTRVSPMVAVTASTPRHTAGRRYRRLTGSGLCRRRRAGSAGRAPPGTAAASWPTPHRCQSGRHPGR
jgi:hypothetical protein